MTNLHQLQYINLPLFTTIINNKLLILFLIPLIFVKFNSFDTLLPQQSNLHSLLSNYNASLHEVPHAPHAKKRYVQTPHPPSRI